MEKILYIRNLEASLNHQKNPESLERTGSQHFNAVPMSLPLNCECGA